MSAKKTAAAAPEGETEANTTAETPIAAETPDKANATPEETAEASDPVNPATAPADEAAPDNGIPAAAEFEPSGAPLQIVPDVDPSHPAVDNDPRAATTADQNRIDFNDPNLTGAEAVAKALAAQGQG